MRAPKQAWRIRGRGSIRQWILSRVLRSGEIATRPGPDANSPLLEPGPSEIVRIPLHRVRIGDSIRQSGENSRHVTALSEVAATLPPIIVHRSHMTVIDGAHRVRAALFSGAQWIDAVYFDGDEGQALLLAIRLNSTHGLPFSAADRKAAAGRALSYFPDWSNRRLAEELGLPERTIALIRKRTAHHSRASTRPATQPLAGHCRGDRLRDQHPAARAGSDPSRLTRALRALRTDPALHRTASGRRLQRLLDTIPSDPLGWTDLLDDLPPEHAATIAELAAQQARAWAALAQAATRQTVEHSTTSEDAAA
ncbi:ParB N-terminal domain-containing protein [Nocardia sp. NPDC059240]|uniref:ParB N-terminal domain-containing protein n=1 Tax=Nocardia sp. NPDC059240 TaxID=3346786 RepID=UPI0036746E1D